MRMLRQEAALPKRLIIRYWPAVNVQSMGNHMSEMDKHLGVQDSYYYLPLLLLRALRMTDYFFFG